MNTTTKDGRGRHGKHKLGNKVKRIVTICIFCGNNFGKTPGFLKQHPNTKYCNRYCASEGRKKVGTYTTINCAYCKKQLSKRTDHLTKNNYCSRKCQSLARTKIDAKWRDKNQIKAYMSNYCKVNKKRHNENSQKWNVLNKTKKLGIQATYRRNNKDKIAVNNRRRNHSKVVGDLTLNQWQEIKKRQGYKCVMCTKIEPEIKLTIDHIIPLSKDGKHTSSNIQGLCKSCNSKKNNKLIEAQHRIEITEVK